MKNTNKRNYAVEIPIDWTAAQADAVIRLLASLEAAVWDAYSDKLTQPNQSHQNVARLERTTSGDDDNVDFPF